MSEYTKAMSAWHRLVALKGGGCGRGASSLMDKHGYFGGIADELCPATREGRERIRALVAKAIEVGWAQRNNCRRKQEPPHGKFALPEAFCGKCGKRPSYCKCGNEK
jgi:hypothetical protein